MTAPLYVIRAPVLGWLYYLNPICSVHTLLVDASCCNLYGIAGALIGNVHTLDLVYEFCVAWKDGYFPLCQYALCLCVYVYMCIWDTERRRGSMNEVENERKCWRSELCFTVWCLMPLRGMGNLWIADAATHISCEFGYRRDWKWNWKSK